MKRKIGRRELLSTLGVVGVTSITRAESRRPNERFSLEELITLESVEDISALLQPQLDDEQLFFLTGWHPNSTISNEENTAGGGVLIYDANRPKSDHNGGTIFSLSVPFNGDVSDYLSAAGETDPTGTGCLLRIRQSDIGVVDFGATSDDVSTDTPAFDAAFEHLDEVFIPFSSKPYRYNGVINLSKSVRGSLNRPEIRCDGVWVDDSVTELAFQNLKFIGAKDYNYQGAVDDGTLGLHFGGSYCKVDHVLVEKFYRGIYVNGWSNNFNYLAIRNCHLCMYGTSRMQDCLFDLFKSVNSYALPDLHNSHGILFHAPQFQNYSKYLFLYQSDIELSAPYFETHPSKPSNAMILIGSNYEVSPSSVTITSPIVNTSEPYIFLNSPVRPTISILGRRAENIKIVSPSLGTWKALDTKSVLVDANDFSMPILAFGGGYGCGNGLDISSLSSVSLSRRSLQLVFTKEDSGFKFTGLDAQERYFIVFDWELTGDVEIKYDSDETEQLIGVNKADGSRVAGIIEWYPRETSGEILFKDTSINVFHFYLSKSLALQTLGAMRAYELSHVTGTDWQIGDLLVTVEPQTGTRQHIWDGTQFV